SFAADGAAFTKTTSEAKADKHVLYTSNAADTNGANGQVVVDLAKGDAWGGGSTDLDTAPTGAANSILNSKNTFEDIQAAHYEMDARIAGDGYSKAKDTAIQTAIKNGTELDFTGVHAAIQGALHLGLVPGNNTNATTGNPNDPAALTTQYQQDLKAANDAVKAVLDNNNGKHATLSDANKAIDTAIKALDKIVDAAKGKTMATNEGENGIVAHAAIQFLKGFKEGLNEANREGLSSIIGLTDDTKTNFGRLSFSSTNGKDIVVEATRDYVGADNKLHSMDITSAIGYDKNVSEKTVSLRETNATIDRETADAMGFNANDWQATDAGDNKNGYAAGVMTLKGAQAMMNIAESAQKALEAIRSDLGSVQN
ncbi:hypothetical protein AVBRAN9333_09325, partial [Campylobacter sp. RM9333]|nr:hypothetical protein [Campylobacter sp. RM9333]